MAVKKTIVKEQPEHEHRLFPHSHDKPEPYRKGSCSGRWFCIDCKVFIDGPKCAL